jgi:hypothetical protein
LIHLISNYEVNGRRDSWIQVCACRCCKPHESSNHQSILLQLQSA